MMDGLTKEIQILRGYQHSVPVAGSQGATVKNVRLGKLPPNSDEESCSGVAAGSSTTHPGDLISHRDAEGKRI